MKEFYRKRGKMLSISQGQEKGFDRLILQGIYYQKGGKCRRIAQGEQKEREKLILQTHFQEIYQEREDNLRVAQGWKKDFDKPNLFLEKHSDKRYIAK